MGPIPSADHHTVDGVAYSVTAATECTVTSDTGLNMTIKAGAQGFLVGDGGDVHVEGSHYFTQCGGNFSPASTGGGGGGGDGRFDTDVVIGHGDGRATCLLRLGDPRAEGLIKDNVDGHRNISCPPDNNRTCQDLVDLINDPTYSDFDVTAELLSDTVLVADESGTLNFYSAGIVKLTAKEPGVAANSIEFTTTYSTEPDTDYPCFGSETVKLGSLNPGADDAAPTSLTLSVNGTTLSMPIKVDVDEVPVQGGKNAISSGWAYSHENDGTLHKTAEESSQLRYLIDNYGKTSSLPRPEEHTEDPERGEGTWTYLSDEQLNTAGLFREQDVKRTDGKWPVYGLLLPWYGQRTGDPDTSSEFYSGTTLDVWDPDGTQGGGMAPRGTLPDCCVNVTTGPGGTDKLVLAGCPWLFDSLVGDQEGVKVRPRRWFPSHASDDGSGNMVDEWIDEPLFKWWDVNYVRCNNGNRRITAVKRADGSAVPFQDYGDVDVGVAFHKRYIFCGRVEALAGGVARDFTLLLISGGPVGDPSFPADVASFLANNFTAVDADGTRIGAVQPVLWKECQRYSYNTTSGTFDTIPAPYGLHSKYQSVLGGSDWSRCHPRSQRGHMITNYSHNNYVSATGDVRDAIPVVDSEGVSHIKLGKMAYHLKGGASYGSGMDRYLFIGLHLMMKSGSKNTQKYMMGNVGSRASSTSSQTFELHVPCAMSTEEAGLDPSTNTKVVVKAAQAGSIRMHDFVTVGPSSIAFNASNATTAMAVASGRVVAISEDKYKDDIAYKEITLELWEGYGKTAFAHTASHYLNRVLPPSGITDVLEARDGSPYQEVDWTNPASPKWSTYSPCRVMGTEYAMGGWNINLDTAVEFKDGNKLRIRYAPPWKSRQDSESGILSEYTPLGPTAGFGKSGSYYGADLVVDIHTGTFYQTAPDSGTGGSSSGLCDQLYKENKSSGVYAYCGFGSAHYLTDAAAGVWGVYVGSSGVAGLGATQWCSCSCD